MPDVSVKPFGEDFPPGGGVEIRIEFTHLEAQTIKNAPAIDVIAGLLAGKSFGMVAGAVVYGLVYSARGEIGEKDKGNGVNFLIKEPPLCRGAQKLDAADRQHGTSWFALSGRPGG